MEVGPEPNNQVRFPLYHSTCLRFICVETGGKKLKRLGSNLELPSTYLPFY